MQQLPFLERWAVYKTTVYMAWSDRRLAAVEISAARAVAEELDLDGTSDVRPGRALQEGLASLGELGLDALTPRGRSVAYASAAWMALADGIEHRVERAVLRTLRYRLGLSSTAGDLLEASALLVRAHGGATPLRTEYRALLHAVSDVVLPLGVDEPPRIH